VNIIINSEFKNLIPPLSAEEKQLLADNILRDGCRDALLLWNDTLIDGHNRHEICSKFELTGGELEIVAAALELLKKRLLHTVENPFGETIQGAVKNKKQLEILAGVLAKLP
jgi:hypothetical protein